MKNIKSARLAARKATNGQYPYIDGLQPRDIQRLMDFSGKPCRSGNIYRVIADGNHRALMFDGNAYYENK